MINVTALMAAKCYLVIDECVDLSERKRLTYGEVSISSCSAADTISSPPVNALHSRFDRFCRISRPTEKQCLDKLLQVFSADARAN